MKWAIQHKEYFYFCTKNIFLANIFVFSINTNTTNMQVIYLW